MTVTLLLFCSLSVCVFGSDVFHVNSKITFNPDEVSEYFGYTVRLSEMGLIVGAPKAKSRVNGSLSPGDVFTCSLNNFDRGNTTCRPLNRKGRMRDYFSDDMWFGAAMDVTSDGTVLSCAPRKLVEVRDAKKELAEYLSDGSCYVYGKRTDVSLSPLSNGYRERQMYVHPATKHFRKEYAEYYSRNRKVYSFTYHKYGMSGMAVTYTEDNTILIGAPGVLAWAGSIFIYKYHPNSFTFDLLPSPNPYFTLDLAPDDYFGYSVESGVFEKNGQVLYVGGAPRSKNGRGQVLIFEKPVREKVSLTVRAKLIGTQMGSYFGASLCTADLNMDGVSDLLVGAPNYAVRADIPTYDQGAVYVYLAKKDTFGFVFEEASIVKGSGQSGARFGTSIADLGDIDGDGYSDVAIGAPWENHGTGVVYIYKGTKNGLMSQYTQRIFSENAKGFGLSISTGLDVDKNGCNDLAIGAYNSNTAYLYRSIPTIQLLTSIKVPELKNLKKDSSNFTALFCFTILPKTQWPNVQLSLDAKVTVDPERNRAKLIGNSEYKVTAKTGNEKCTSLIIEVNSASDFSKPIPIKFQVKPEDLDVLRHFPLNSARLSDDSSLQSSFTIQLLSDCGDNLICEPWLVMNLEPLVSKYIPGVDSPLGVKVSVTNVEEPAYSVKLHLVLPCPPKRLPDSCSLENLDVTCDLPAPLNMNQTAEWEIQLEYIWDGSDTKLMVVAELKDPLYMRNISEGVKELTIPIVPQVSYNFSGKAQLNSTVYVTRSTLENNGDVLFTHYYEITNYGPSDLYMRVEFVFSEEIAPVKLKEGSSLQNNTLTFIPTKLKANETTGYIISLRFNLTQFGETFASLQEMQVSSTMLLYIHNGDTKENRSMEVTTYLVLEPTVPIWPVIVAFVLGLLVLAVIMFGLYKCGFFSRPKKEDLKKLVEDNGSAETSKLGDNDRSVQDIDL